MPISCNVSEYFPSHYDGKIPYNMAKHRIYGENNKKIDEYTERGCAESELVEDIHENFCTIGQIEDLVERGRVPGSKLKRKCAFTNLSKTKILLNDIAVLAKICLARLLRSKCRPPAIRNLGRLDFRRVRV